MEEEPGDRVEVVAAGGEGAEDGEVQQHQRHHDRDEEEEGVVDAVAVVPRQGHGAPEAGLHLGGSPLRGGGGGGGGGGSGGNGDDHGEGHGRFLHCDAFRDGLSFFSYFSSAENSFSSPAATKLLESQGLRRLRRLRRMRRRRLRLRLRLRSSSPSSSCKRQKQREIVRQVPLGVGVVSRR